MKWKVLWLWRALRYWINLWTEKKKQVKKRTLLQLLWQSCFVTVSCICCYFCWVPLDVERPGNWFRVCATSPRILLPLPPSPVQMTSSNLHPTPFPTRLHLHRATSKAGVDENSEKAEGRSSHNFAAPPPSLCDDGENKNGRKCEYIKAVSLFPFFLSHLVPKGPFFNSISGRLQPPSLVSLDC